MGNACCPTQAQAQSQQVQNEINASQKISEKTHKLLLLGPGNSGKSTFFKQLCKIHSNGFQSEDIQMAQQNIYDCVIDQMIQLIETLQQNIKYQNKSKNNKSKHNKTNSKLKSFNNNNIDSDDDYEELLNDSKYDEYSDFTYKLEGESKKYADYLTSNNLPRGGIEITPDIAKMIEVLWNDESIKQTFYNRTNLGVVDSAPHFFNDIQRIGSLDFKPTSDDILLVRMPTTGIFLFISTYLCLCLRVHISVRNSVNILYILYSLYKYSDVYVCIMR